MIKASIAGFKPSGHGIGSMLLLASFQLAAQTNQEIYTDSLQNGWADWGWAQINYANSSPVHQGSKSVSVTMGAWQAIYMEHSDFDCTLFTNLSLWLNGGASGGQQLRVQALIGGSQQNEVSIAPLPRNTWTNVIVSLSSLGVAGSPNLDGFWVADRIGVAQPVFYVDDVVLIGGPPPPQTTNSSVTVSLNATANRHLISPLIYGVAFATSNQLADLNSPVNRSGGNGETRYNWQVNAHNHGADWYFESIADSSSAPGADGDDFVSQSRAGNAEPMLTVPMIGWAPKLGSNRGKLASYSISKYGAQTGNDGQWFADAGNGIRASDSTPITWNDPNDANVAVDSAFEQDWVRHLTNRWGTSEKGGVHYYFLDNEHSIWHATHQDVHPIGATMREIRDRMFEYASRVKEVDPAAWVLGPEEWGWSGYLYSGYDQQWGSQHGWSSFPDRSTNGGWDYLPWLLDQFRRRDATNGTRLLDYFTVHFYPQNGEYENGISASMQTMRNKSTRSLWDPKYVEPNWIADTVRLIPRLKSWVATNYPGTKIGITEYNWGAENHINGATAQADILGIFGREELDLGVRWTTPDVSTPTYKAMKLYRNYDGNRSGFGDISISATVPDPDSLSVFAAVRSTDGALTMVAINKVAGWTPVSVVVTNYLSKGMAQVWQLTASNSITQMPDLHFTGNSFTNTVPPQSVSLFVMTAGTAPRLEPGALADDGGTFDLWLFGQSGQRYAIQSSVNLVAWNPAQTNYLESESLHLTLSAATRQTYYRAVWVP